MRPSEVHVPSASELLEVADLIRPWIHRTPVVTSQYLNDLSGASHTSMILIAILHWNKPAETHPALEHGPCDTRLGASLIAYGIVGLGFVYLLFRDFL